MLRITEKGGKTKHFVGEAHKNQQTLQTHGSKWTGEQQKTVGAYPPQESMKKSKEHVYNRDPKKALSGT